MEFKEKDYIMKYKLTNQWLLGFTDGEGCFHIGVTVNKSMKLGYQVIPEFTIVQHIKDVSLLYAIRDYLGCGIVQSNRGKKMIKTQNEGLGGATELGL